MKPITNLLAIVLLVAWSSSASAEQFWDIQTVPDDGLPGFRSSLALDAFDRPHISFGNDATPRGLHYAAFDGTQWNVQVVDAMRPRETSLALDAAGRPHVLYTNLSLGELRYAAFDGTDWDVQIVPEPGGDVRISNRSLAFDGDGLVHVAYASDFDVVHGTFDGDAWSLETVVTGNALQPSLVLDDGGRPHLAYRRSSKVNYAFFDGLDWHDNTPLGDVHGIEPSLALDAEGRPHVAYFASDPNRIEYARLLDGEEGIQLVQTADEWWPQSGAVLVLDADDRPHIVYPEMKPPFDINMKYAFFDGDAWDIHLVDPEDLTGGDGRSLAMDALGRPHVSYLYSDTFTTELRYAVLIPEPASLTLLGVGAALLIARRHRTYGDRR